MTQIYSLILVFIDFVTVALQIDYRKYWKQKE